MPAIMRAFFITASARNIFFPVVEYISSPVASHTCTISQISTLYSISSITLMACCYCSAKN